MKKVSKILSVLLVAVVILTISTTVFAASTTPNQLMGNASYDVSSITGLGNNIITILSTIGIIVSVVVLIVLGIKYMMGSAEEKAEYKKTLLPYIIGAAFVFAASSIAQIVYNFTSGI